MNDNQNQTEAQLVPSLAQLTRPRDSCLPNPPSRPANDHFSHQKSQRKKQSVDEVNQTVQVLSTFKIWNLIDSNCLKIATLTITMCLLLVYLSSFIPRHLRIMTLEFRGPQHQEKTTEEIPKLCFYGGLELLEFRWK